MNNRQQPVKVGQITRDNYSIVLSADLIRHAQYCFLAIVTPNDNITRMSGSPLFAPPVRSASQLQRFLKMSADSSV